MSQIRVDIRLICSHEVFVFLKLRYEQNGNSRIALRLLWNETTTSVKCWFSITIVMKSLFNNIVFQRYSYQHLHRKIFDLIQSHVCHHLLFGTFQSHLNMKISNITEIDLMHHP